MEWNGRRDVMLCYGGASNEYENRDGLECLDTGERHV